MEKLSQKQIDVFTKNPNINWNYVKDGRVSKLQARFDFDTFGEAVAFVGRSADLINRLDHHPIIKLDYSVVDMSLWTHDVGGITDKDIKLATQIDELYDEYELGTVFIRENIMKKEVFSFVGLMISIINFVFGLVILGLSVRFLFRLFDANSEDSLVKFIYNSTSPLLDPFRGIFPPDAIEPGSVLEYSTLMAILFYMIFVWFLAELIYVFSDYVKQKRV